MVYFQSYRWNYLPELYNTIQNCSGGKFCFFVRKLSKNPLVMEIFVSKELRIGGIRNNCFLSPNTKLFRHKNFHFPKNPSTFRGGPSMDLPWSLIVCPWVSIRYVFLRLPEISSSEISSSEISSQEISSSEISSSVITFYKTSHFL